MFYWCWLMDCTTIVQAIRGPKRKIKKSIFIGTIFPVKNKKQIEERLVQISEEFAKANHNAWAYRLLYKDNKIITDFDDDGEVRGTAGRVIMTHLENNRLVNVLLVVTRYYGGINLGKGGLIRAYSQTALDLVDNVEIIQWKK